MSCGTNYRLGEKLGREGETGIGERVMFTYQRVLIGVNARVNRVVTPQFLAGTLTTH